MFSAELLEEHQAVLLDAVREIEAAAAEAREEFADVPVSDDQVEKEVKRRKWELAGQDLAELLDVPEPPR